MSGSAKASRRQFLRLLALLACGRALAAERPKGGGDNGIGGTGLKPADNGIGGTGFIGTIRKFGSVWVNGERIAYPDNVRIRIDGEAVAPAAMRIGQVARLVAERRETGWTTNAIVIVSEVVGPISRIGHDSLEVLGQKVFAPNAKMAHGLAVGDRVAVSGLRRPDQTIVASLIEKRLTGPDQIAGVLTEDDGGFGIGGQSMAGVGRAVVGERIVARGAMANGVFAASEVKLDTVIAIGAVQNLSVETWVVERGGQWMTAGGLRIEDGAADLGQGPHHVVINGALGANGALLAREVALPNAHGDFAPPRGAGGPGGGPSGGAGHPGGGGLGRPSGLGSPGGGSGPGGFPGGPNSAAPGLPGGLPSIGPGGGFGGFGRSGGLPGFGGFGGPMR